MESQPQNPEIRINPENFQPCTSKLISAVNSFHASSDFKLVIIVPSLFIKTGDNFHKCHCADYIFS